jgi:hypothetical protein
MSRLRTRADTRDTAISAATVDVNPTAELSGKLTRGSSNLDYIVDPIERLITIVGEYGEAADWRALLTRMLHDSRIQPGFAILRDRRAAPTPVDIDVVVAVMDAIRRFWPHLQPSRAAILISRECDPIRLAAYSLAQACGLSVVAFTSYDEARRWLREGTR